MILELFPVGILTDKVVSSRRGPENRSSKWDVGVGWSLVSFPGETTQGISGISVVLIITGVGVTQWGGQSTGTGAPVRAAVVAAESLVSWLRLTSLEKGKT